MACEQMRYIVSTYYSRSEAVHAFGPFSWENAEKFADRLEAETERYEAGDRVNNQHYQDISIVGFNPPAYFGTGRECGES